MYYEQIYKQQQKKNSSVTVVSEDKNCQICFGCHHNVHFIGDIKQVPIA